MSPIVAALEGLEVGPDAGRAAPVGEAAGLSLVEALSRVPDPRKPRGVRHGVLAVLLLGACAVLAGARSFTAIAEYAHDVGRAVLDVLGVGAVAPHESTIRRVLQRVDASALEAALQSWVLPQLSAQPAPEGTPRREQRRVLALDGKTLRGARVRAADGRVWLPHLVSVLDQTSGGVLGQVQVAEKGSEITAFTALLDPLDLDDVLVTADALHTQRAHADGWHGLSRATPSSRARGKWVLTWVNSRGGTAVSA
ncbi:ISAs1 family transposase [Pseudonocardia sp. ICBG601]|uniref:ISAs1 family transposase n=1 Tax=Pseudonocardia sp. ICBG601 TaxID=2846759 RepID=UPI001CF69AE4|nr:ISAs1 family transposase [Pseudonocardia sp. ICBG601]